MATTYINYGPALDSDGWGPQSYVQLVVTETTTKYTIKVNFGVRPTKMAIPAGWTVKGKLTGNVEWKTYSKTTTATAQNALFQVGTVTVEREKRAGSTYTFSANWYADIVGYGTCDSVSYTFTIQALPTYKITYNANGGSGAPAQQTKTHGIALSLSSTKPTRSNYTFVSWNTNSSGTGTNYASGASYTANAAVTLYARWTPVTYAVKYNANGGSGAPAQQTKVYGTTLKLSSTIPTRSGYTFVRWNTNSSGTGTNYASGANYTANAAVTLYAVWQVNYTPPQITSLTAYRVDTDGNKDDEGTSFKVDFTWVAGTDSNGSVTLLSAIIKWKKTTESSYPSANNFSANITSTNVSIDVGITAALDTDAQYDVQVTLTPSSSHPDIVRMTYISTSSFIIDVNAAGNAVGIGMAAPDVDANGNPITGNSQLHIGSDIYLNSNNAFKKDITVEKSSSWDTPKVIVTQNDENNNLIAKGALSSTYGGNFGLYDQHHSRWLIRSDSEGRPHIGFSPKTLHSTKVACTKVGTAYENTTISDLANWNVVAVYFAVHQQTRLLWFVRGIQADISFTDTPDAGYFRGSIFVDWTNNRISMRCINAGTSGTYYNLVYFQGVYGIM